MHNYELLHYHSYVLYYGRQYLIYNSYHVIRYNCYSIVSEFEMHILNNIKKTESNVGPIRSYGLLQVKLFIYTIIPGATVDIFVPLLFI